MTDFLSTVEEVIEGLPTVQQITSAIQLAEDAYSVVTKLVGEAKGVLTPGDLASVQKALNDAVAARKAQQAVTDAALSKAASGS